MLRLPAPSAFTGSAASCPQISCWGDHASRVATSQHQMIAARGAAEYKPFLDMSGFAPHSLGAPTHPSILAQQFSRISIKGTCPPDRGGFTAIVSYPAASYLPTLPPVAQIPATANDLGVGMQNMACTFEPMELQAAYALQRLPVPGGFQSMLGGPRHPYDSPLKTTRQWYANPLDPYEEPIRRACQ
jgi:hypothetical protein